MEEEGKIKRYIAQTLGLDCEISTEVQLGLPLYLKGRFTFSMLNIEGNDFLLLMPRRGVQMTASVMCSSADSIRKQSGYKTIILLDGMNAEVRRIFISRKESFIVPDRQLYVPQLGLLLQERGMQNGRDKETEMLSPAAQRLLLYHLQVQSLNGLSLSCLSGLLGYPAKTITMIVKELTGKVLCSVSTQDARCKCLQFSDDGKGLWDKVYPYLQNPIKSIRYVDDISAVSGIGEKYTHDKALAHYTFIADNENLAVAMYWRSEIIGSLNLNEHEGNVRVELWKYPPIIVSESDYVDPLSLVLCFRDDDDERVKAELKKLTDKTFEK